MATGPITSWQIEGEDMKVVTDFTFLGSMITADGDSSHKIKRHLLLGRKVMTNLASIFFLRDITLPTNVCIVKAMSFPGSLLKRWPKYWSLHFRICPSSEHSGSVSFKMDRFILFAVQGLSRVSSSTAVQKHQFLSSQPSLQSSSHFHTSLLEKP